MIQFINRCNTFSLPRPAQNNTTMIHNIDSSFNEYLEELKKPISKENNNYSEDAIKYKKTILGQTFTNYNLSDSVDLSEIDLQNVDVNDIIYNIKPFLIGNHVITNILLSINSIDDKYSQQKIQLAHDIVGWLRQEKDILSLDYQVFEILSHSLYTTDADISEYVTLSCNKNSDEEGITPSEISLSNTTKPEENISTITGVLINLVMDTVMYMTGELIIPEFNKLYTGYNIYNKLTLIYQDPESGKTEKLRQLGYQLDKIAPNISSSDIKKYIKLFSSLLVDTTIIWDKLQNLYQQDSLLQSITETLNSVSLSIKKTSLTGNQLSAQWSNIANILHLLANGLSLVNNLCSLPENSTAEHYFDLFFKSTSLVNSMQPLLDLGKSLSVLKNYPCQGSSAEQLSWLLEGISNPELSPYIEPVTGKAPLAFIKSAAEFPANGTLSEQIESAYHLLGNTPGVSTFSSAFRENLYIDEITHLLTMLIKISKGEECYTILTSLCTTGEGKNILSAGLHSAASMAIPYMGPIPQFLNSGWQLWNSLLSNQSWSDITKNILSILTESLIAPMTDPLGERTLRLAQAIAQHNSWEETITHIILQGSNAGEKDINFYKQYLNLLLGWKIYQAFQESDPDKLKSQLCHISFELKKLINVPEWTYLNTLIDFIPLLPALQKADISIPMQNENLITWANRMLHTLSNSTDLGIVTLRHDLSAQITKWTAEALIAGFSAMISGAVSPDQTQKKAMPSPAEGWGLSDIAHGTSHWLVTVDKTLDNAINSIFPWKVVDASPLPETTPNSETAETVIGSEQFSVSNHNLISDVDKTGIDHIQDTYNDIITLYDGFILDFLEENEEDEINNPWRQYAEYTLMGTWWAFVAYKTLQTCKKNKYTETLSADTPLTVFSTNGEGEQSETLLSLPETTKPNKTGIISQYKTPLMMAAAGIFIPGLLWYLRSESSGAKEKDFPKIQLSDEEFNALSAKLSNDEKELFEKTAFNHAPEHHIQKRVVYHDLSYTYRDLQYIQENTVPVHLTLGNFIHRMEEKHKITIFNSLNKIMVKRFIYDDKTDSGRYHEDISLHRYLITGPGDSVEQHINYKLPSTLPERLAKDLQQYHRRDQKRIRIAKDLYRKLEYTERRIVSEYKNDFPGFIRYLQRRHHLNDFINKSSYVTYYEEGTINEKKCSLEDALTKIDRNHVIIYERWFYHPKFRILIKYFEYFREIYEQKNNLVKKVDQDSSINRKHKRVSNINKSVLYKTEKLIKNINNYHGENTIADKDEFIIGYHEVYGDGEDENKPEVANSAFYASVLYSVRAQEEQAFSKFKNKKITVNSINETYDNLIKEANSRLMKYIEENQFSDDYISKEEIALHGIKERKAQFYHLNRDLENLELPVADGKLTTSLVLSARTAAMRHLLRMDLYMEHFNISGFSDKNILQAATEILQTDSSITGVNGNIQSRLLDLEVIYFYFIKRSTEKGFDESCSYKYSDENWKWGKPTRTVMETFDIFNNDKNLPADIHFFRDFYAKNSRTFSLHLKEFQRSDNCISFDSYYAQFNEYIQKHLVNDASMLTQSRLLNQAGDPNQTHVPLCKIKKIEDITFSTFTSNGTFNRVLARDSSNPKKWIGMRKPVTIPKVGVHTNIVAHIIQTQDYRWFLVESMEGPMAPTITEISLAVYQKMKRNATLYLGDLFPDREPLEAENFSLSTGSSTWINKTVEELMHGIIKKTIEKKINADKKSLLDKNFFDEIRSMIPYHDTIKRMIHDPTYSPGWEDLFWDTANLVLTVVSTVVPVIKIGMAGFQAVKTALLLSAKQGLTGFALARLGFRAAVPFLRSAAREVGHSTAGFVVPFYLPGRHAYLRLREVRALRSI